MYLLAEGPAGLDKPYAYDSHFYIFQENTVKQISHIEISRMLANTAIASQRWERMPNGNVTIDDFDREELQALRKLFPWNNED